MSIVKAEPKESPLAVELARDLGQFLVQRGWLTPEDLQLASEHQQARGGQLGTAMLEIGLITEDRLLDALSQVLGVPAAFARDLHDIPRAAWGLLPTKVATRHRAIPFRIVGGELWVAMSEVNDLAAQDEIAAVTGRRLRPHLALEPRIIEALSTCYQITCPDRFTELLVRLDLRPNLWGVAHPPAVRQVPEVPVVPAVEPVSGSAGGEITEAKPRPPRRPRSIPLTTEERARLAEVREEERLERDRERRLRAVSQGRALSEPEWAELEGRLHRASSREEIAEAVLDVLAERFRRGILLKVQGDRVCGWLGRGPGIDRKALAAFSAGFDQPSVFLNLHQGVEFHLGPLSEEMSVHLDLADVWGGSMPGHVLVMPVRVRDRLVAFLYGDRPRPEPAAVDLAEMRRLVKACASAFELFLMRKKLRKA